jgi:hypothetical protein
MTPLLDLLSRLYDHAEAERRALRGLDTRALFELAAHGEELSRQLAALLAQVTPAELASPRWAQVRQAAAQARDLAASNADVVRRSLELVRALKPALGAEERPALVSQRA